jgi:flagellin
MPLGILNNIPSLAAENQLTLTSTALSHTLEQLSSGSRINSGADDPAGLSIANGLQANISALTQSVSNANNGVGQLQLADGALAQVTTLLNTAVTLATESATGTVSNSQRVAIQAQYSSILSEINRIGQATTYNGQAVFQSGVAPNLNAANSANSGTTAPVSLQSALTVGDATSVTAGGVTFTYTAAAGAANPNVQNSTGTAETGATALVSSLALSIVHGGATTTYTTTAATTATVATLMAAINTAATSGAGAAGVTVAGGSGAGLVASIQNGQLQITDTAGNNNLATTGFAVITGATAFANSTAPTVQSLVNAINNDTTVGAKATVTSGQLQITDPLDRGNLAVTTNDNVLGAPVSGAPTSFVTPSTTTATPNANGLQSSAALTLTTALTNGAITSFTVGGKSFSFTAGASSKVGDLINAINTPGTDPAGLTAYLDSNGKLQVVDPNNNGNIKAGSTTTETALGSFSNPTTTASTTTNIFLSDSTAIGSSQIAVSIGGLSASGITNGSNGNSVNLATGDLNTQTDAQAALTQINTAISNIASVRGTLGASVNRLTAASNVLNSQVQNLTSAENTITAADIPSAVATLTKYSILEQTGISALAQANQQQQLVLKLLQ